MENKKYICKTCNKYYKSPQSMSNHKKKYHTNISPNITIISSKYNSDMPPIIPHISITTNINKIQKKTDNTICEYCNKKLSTYTHLRRHLKTCKMKNKKIDDYDKLLKENEEIKQNHDKIKKAFEDLNNKIVLNNEIIQDEIIQDENIKDENIQDNIIKNQEKQIKLLKKIIIKKQKRIIYPNKNVIYILTTIENKKDRIYIIGKTKNLTNRLSTYNKTTEHEVIYYKECKNEDDMSVIENIVLLKLKLYKEKANRDRFILPIDSDISLFTHIIDEAITFFN